LLLAGVESVAVTRIFCRVLCSHVCNADLTHMNSHCVHVVNAQAALQAEGKRHSPSLTHCHSFILRLTAESCLRQTVYYYDRHRPTGQSVSPSRRHQNP
jgi:hypothetical protein